jgi:hypothetical protein
MTDSYDPWANFNPLPQAQKEQTDWMKNYSSGQYNQSNPGQGVRYNTDQGMNNDPWGNRDLNNLAGNGGGGGQYNTGQGMEGNGFGKITGSNPWDFQFAGTENPGEIPMNTYTNFLQSMAKNPNGQYDPALIRSGLYSGEISGAPGNYQLTQNGQAGLNSILNGDVTQARTLGPGQQISNGVISNFGQPISAAQGGNGGVTQDTRGLQGFGAPPNASQLFGGNQTSQAGGQQQANPYGGMGSGGQQQGTFDYNDRAQQDAFVRSLGGNAPAIFGDNGHMTDQDWATRYDAIRQASMGRPLDSFGGPAQQTQRGPGNYYGQGGAQGFNELSGELAQNGDRFKDAFGKFGWNLVTPQGGSQGQAENIARAMATQNPNVDYEPVDMGGGVWNIATRSRLPGGGQPYSGLLPQPVMPPPVSPAQRYSPAPPRYSSGGGGGYAPRPAAPAPRPVVSAPIQNTMANIFRGIPNIAQLIHGMQPAQQGQIINSPFGGPQVVNGWGQGVPISNVPSSGT